MRVENNRGQAGKVLIVLIVLVVIALVVWGIFALVSKDSVDPNDLANQPADPIAQQCASLCETNQTAGFCEFNVQASDSVRTTCYALATNPQYSEYGVQSCATISCETATQVSDQSCAGLGGTWQTPEGTSCPAEEGKLVRKRTAEDAPPVEGQICCYYYE